jgi:hypothetical protein
MYCSGTEIFLTCSSENVLRFAREMKLLVVTLFTNPVSMLFHFRKVLCFAMSHSHILYVTESFFLFFSFVLWLVLLQVCKFNLCCHCIIIILCIVIWFGTTVYEPHSHFLIKAVLKKNKAVKEIGADEDKTF